MITFNGNTGKFIIDKVEVDISARQFIVTGVLPSWAKWGREQAPPELLITPPGQRHPQQERAASGANGGVAAI
jgi:hypothetical protein